MVAYAGYWARGFFISHFAFRHGIGYLVNFDYICDMIQDVLEYEGAIVDNTNAVDRKVVLTDKEEPYKQRFFVDDDDLELIERCKHMRELGIPSL